MIRKFYKDAAVIGLAGAVVRLKGLVVLPFLVNHFGAADYAVWSQVTMIALTFAITVRF